MKIDDGDAHDRALRDNVRPCGWPDPTPQERYNMVVIGGGTAGLVTAAGAAGLGARVALVERDALGGDCLNTGCVPSKALLRSARAAAAVRRAGAFGVRVAAAAEVDFAAVMRRMRELRAELSRSDSAERLRGLGVDVYFGSARFVAHDRIEVEGTTLRFSRACIATGARAAVPDIPGLREAGFLTNETLFSVGRLPERLAVIGGGPIGCEMAQAFARFGARVWLIEAADRLLGNDDERAGELIADVLRADGIDVRTATTVESVSLTGHGEKSLRLRPAGHGADVAVDEILVAVGRRPNVEDLDLAKAGIGGDARGVEVDARLRTRNRRVFSAGDVCLPQRFTHAADAAARIVIRNALFFGRARFRAETIPWCTYTEPEVAHVGITARGAAEKGIAIRTFAIDLGDVDRARLDGEEVGFLEVHVAARADAILGATMVGSHAGETIAEIALAISARVGLGRLADVIHCYPTQAEAVRKAADAHNRARLTPRVRSLFERLMALRR
jgi:pyruvate/2-oxoglutarate dehydrogenase complex dihydrolipoamide dehydrogenase (E3) component